MIDEGGKETSQPIEAPEIPLPLKGTPLGKWLDSLEGPRPDDKEMARKAWEELDNLHTRQKRGELTEEEWEQQDMAFYRQTLLPIELRRENPQFKESLSALLKEILLPEGRLGFRVSWKISPDLEHLPDVEAVVKQEARNQEIAKKIVDAIQGGNLTVLEAALYAYGDELRSRYRQWQMAPREEWLGFRQRWQQPSSPTPFGLAVDTEWEQRVRRLGFRLNWSEVGEREYQAHLQKLEEVRYRGRDLGKRGSKFNQVIEENGGKWAPWEKYIEAGWDKNRAAISTTSTP